MLCDDPGDIHSHSWCWPDGIWRDYSVVIGDGIRHWLMTYSWRPMTIVVGWAGGSWYHGTAITALIQADDDCWFHLFPIYWWYWYSWPYFICYSDVGPIFIINIWHSTEANVFAHIDVVVVLLTDRLVTEGQRHSSVTSGICVVDTGDYCYSIFDVWYSDLSPDNSVYSIVIMLTYYSFIGILTWWPFVLWRWYYLR